MGDFLDQDAIDALSLSEEELERVIVDIVKHHDGGISYEDLEAATDLVHENYRNMMLDSCFWRLWRAKQIEFGVRDGEVVYFPKDNDARD